MVELKHFTKKYKDFTAVSDISFKCQEGEITGILGPNGAGKTTLLKAVCARHLASGGSVLVENINADDETEKIRNLTGFVTEEPDFPGEYTVFEYLDMIFLLHAEKNIEKIFKSKNENKKNAEYISNLIKELSLDEILSKKIKKLSKGQRQRVNFAQALIYNPPVLILDEPASGLDPSQIIKMRKFVLSQKKMRTIILSTHIMQEAQSLCDNILILSNGKIAAEGTIQKIIEETKSKNLEDAFFFLTQNQGKKNY